MAATLTINLKDNATPGLQELEQQLVRTSDATGEVAADTRQLTVAQQEQIKVIHEHRAAWSQLAASVGPTLVNLVQGAGSLGLAYVQLRRNALLVAAAKQAIVTAGTRAIGVLTGTGPAVAITYGSYKALTSILDATGREFQQSADATDEQKAAFERLKIEATTAGQSLQRYAKESGQSLEELGATTTSNLNKIETAGGKLGSALAAPFSEGAAAAGALLDEINPLPALLEAIDKGVTAATDAAVEGLEYRAEGTRALVDNIRAKTITLGGGDGGQYLKEIEQLRELEQLHDRLNEQREKEQEHFARLRQVHAEYEAQRQNAAEAERLRGLDTLAEIDAEITRQKDLAGQKAAALQFDEKAQQQHLSRLNQLEQQRTQIVRAEAEKQKRLREEIREETERREKESLQRRIDAENDALRRSVEAYNQWAADVRAARKRADDFAREYADTANNAILENLITRLDAEGDQDETAHRARQELIQQETDQRIAAADTQEERERAFYDGLKRLQREDLAHQQRVIRDEVAARKQAADEAVRIEQQKRDALQRLLQQAGAPDAKELLGQIDPRKALMDQRGKAAADAARRRVLEDPDNQRLRTEALTSVGASNRLRRMQEAAARQAEREARVGAGRAFNRGEVDPRELSQAQRQAGQQMLQTLQQNRQLSGDVVQVLQQQLQAAADQQGTLAVLQQQVAQLQRASQAIGNGAAAQRQRAQRGGV